MKMVAVLFLVAILMATPALAIAPAPTPVSLPSNVMGLVNQLLGFLGLGGIGGGIPVSDGGTHSAVGGLQTTAVMQLNEAIATVKQLKKEYDLAWEMAQMIKSLPNSPLLRQWLLAWAHDTFNLNAGWLYTANTGMPGYMQSVYPRPIGFEQVFAHLPVPAQLRAKLAYSMGELLDGVNERALIQIGGIRTQSASDLMIIKNLLDQHLNPDPSAHGTQQSLDRIGIATAANMQDQQDVKRLLGSLVELEVARSMQQRNAIAITAEQQIARVTQGPVVTSAVGDMSGTIVGFRW